MKLFTLPLFICAPFVGACALSASDGDIISKTDGFVAAWDFSEAHQFESTCGKYSLENVGGVKIVPEGPISGKSAEFNGSNFLKLPYAKTGALNVSKNEVTVIAWVKWSGEGIGFVGGMWNEYQDGGKRQYGLFVSLPHYNGGDNVCGHISKTGKPTPPFPFSIDYSASGQKVPHNKWVCVAFTYDGKYIRSYLDGKFVERPKELIDNTKGFAGYPEGLVQSKNPYYFPDGIGDNGSDFTVGAVLLKRGMGNFFKGQIGGLFVFDKALSESKLAQICTSHSHLK